MRLTAKTILIAIILGCAAVAMTESLAHAQCPPGFHWSYRVGACVPGGPPPGYYPPPPPPPPPGWGRERRCNWIYQNCVRDCAGYPGCANRCDHRYNRCLRGW